jgi:hypothetical protein
MVHITRIRPFIANTFGGIDHLTSSLHLKSEVRLNRTKMKNRTGIIMMLGWIKSLSR